MNISINSWFEYLYLKQQKKLIYIIVLALCAAAYLGFITPKLISDLYASYEQKELFYPALKSLGILFLCEYFVQVVYQLSLSRYIQLLIQQIRTKSFSNWIKSHESLGSSSFGDSKYPLGEVLSRVLSDTEAIIELVSSGSLKIIIDLTYIVSCLVSFVYLNTTSGITLIAAEIIACFLLVLGSRKMADVYLAVRKSAGIMSRVIANITAGFRFTFYTPNKSYASNRSFASFEDFLKKQLKANIWDAGYYSIAESLFPLLLVILVLVFPYSNIVEMAILASIIDLIQRSISPIKEFASKISSIQRAKSGLIRIQEFNNDISNLPSIDFDEHFDTIDLSSLRVKVNSFKYPKMNENTQREGFALKDIEFDAKAGELVGIVGLSGSGKSTLLKILSTDIIADTSMIEITTNTNKKIKFSKNHLENFDIYKRQVSIVSQDSHVFTESLAFNITLSSDLDSEMSEKFDRFWANVVQEISYIKKWGIEPDTLIKPKELSLGQKQLLSALRSCFLTKPIVLFDEISSGLDSELEEALRILVLLIQKHSLTFIVAHRIETIVNAQKIIVLSAGEVESMGEHSELLRTSATYQEFITQLKGSSIITETT